MKSSRLITAFLNGAMLAAIAMNIAVGTAVAATVSGTITNNSGKSGRIFLVAQGQGDPSPSLGVSIDPAVTLNYAIRGVQQGVMYQVKAFMDIQNTGIQHANDPVGYSSSFTVTGSSYSGANITLNNPTPVSLQAPTSTSALTGDRVVFIGWGTAKDTFGNEIATSYKVYWSTTPNPGPGNMTGGGSSPEVSPQDNPYYPVAFPSNGGQYYFSVTASLNSVESAPTNVNGGALITIAPPASGITVSGTINSPGIPLTTSTPLFVVLVTTGPRYISLIPIPTNSQSYSISGVQPGTYRVSAVLILNSNGKFDEGIINNFTGEEIIITAGSTNLSNVDITLTARDAAIKVATYHWKQGVNEGYSLQSEIRPQLKRPVNVAVSGTQLGEVLDLTPNQRIRYYFNWNVSARPTLSPPDTYQFAMTYADGTTTGMSPLSASLTGIVDSFATPLSPVGSVPVQLPPTTFSWSAPLAPPSPFYYSLWLGTQNNQYIDSFDRLSNSTTSVNVSYLFSEGTTYNWNISVKDRYGNQAMNQTSFTPSSNLAISGFSPTFGVPGTKVTISGTNFDGTTPSNNCVVFPGTGVCAPLVSATSSQLVVTVPSGAAPSSGPINLYVGTKNTASSSFFTVLSTISTSGTIRSSAGTESGAVVELPGNDLLKTISAGNGTYTLAGLPSGQTFSFKVSKPPYPDVYSKNFNTTINLTGINFRLYSAADVAGWGVTTGTGVIRGRVLNSVDGTAINGATVTITSQNHAGYTVVYANTDFVPEPALTSTSEYGVFYIRNITPGDSITVSATAAGFSNVSGTFTVYANAVTMGAISLVDNMRPIIENFTMPVSYNNLTVPVTLTASDNAAVTGYLLSESASPPSPGAAGWSLQPPQTFTFSTTGPHTLYAWAKDVAGNVSFGSSQNVTITYKLTINITGWGTVTETTAAPTLSCINPPNSSCNQNYSPGGPLRLAATPYSGYEFQSWGACTPTVSDPLMCDLNLTGDTDVSATFLLTNRVRIGLVYYPSINAAAAVAADRDTIQIRDLDLQENVAVNRSGITMTLRGGYDAGFNPTSGFTTLNKLTIRGGKVIAAKIKIQ